MDLIKKLTGKNPSEYEMVAKSLVDNSDVELFAKLVKQDDFLFDFIKNNVAKYTLYPTVTEGIYISKIYTNDKISAIDVFMPLDLPKNITTIIKSINKKITDTFLSKSIN